MFTVKLINNHEWGDEIVLHSVKNVKIEREAHSATITTDEGTPQQQTFEVNNKGDEPGYCRAYVENPNGKTTESIDFSDVS